MMDLLWHLMANSLVFFPNTLNSCNIHKGLLYSSKVNKRIKNTRVLGVRLSVPSGAYAETVGAGWGRTTIVAAALRLKVGKPARYGLRTGFNVGAPIAGSGDMIGKKGL